MPYCPEVTGAGKPGEKPSIYRMGGPACPAWDVIGDYSFERLLKEGDRLVLRDMAICSMIKNNTINGIDLPAIFLAREDGTGKLVRSFGYGDFKSSL